MEIEEMCANISNEICRGKFSDHDQLTVGSSISRNVTIINIFIA